MNEESPQVPSVIARAFRPVAIRIPPNSIRQIEFLRRAGPWSRRYPVRFCYPVSGGLMNFGMIATGNHVDFDSLRVAPPPLLSALVGAAIGRPPEFPTCSRRE